MYTNIKHKNKQLTFAIWFLHNLIFRIIYKWTMASMYQPFQTQFLVK